MVRLNTGLMTSAAAEQQKAEQRAALKAKPAPRAGAESAPSASKPSIYDAAPRNTTMPREAITEEYVPIITSVCPDVCWTPLGSKMVAIPYNVYSRADEGCELTSTVRVRGKRLYTLRSFTKGSKGAEPGTGGGVVSGTTGEKCEPIEGSRTVRAEGSPIIRDGDMFYMNNRNTIGKVRHVLNTKIYKTPAAYSDEYARSLPADAEIHEAKGRESDDE